MNRNYTKKQRNLTGKISGNEIRQYIQVAYFFDILLLFHFFLFLCKPQRMLNSPEIYATIIIKPLLRDEMFPTMVAGGGGLGERQWWWRGLGDGWGVELRVEGGGWDRSGVGSGSQHWRRGANQEGVGVWERGGRGMGVAGQAMGGGHDGGRSKGGVGRGAG